MSKKKKNDRQAGQAKATKANPPKPPKGVVLVVDDEPIMRKIALKVLKDEGYEVLSAEDGAQGLQLFSKYHSKITLVLLDMVLPHMSGKEVYMEMKKIDPELTVLLNTGFKDDERVQEVFKLGIRDFIEKPYSFKQLVQAVEKAIKR